MRLFVPGQTNPQSAWLNIGQAPYVASTTMSQSVHGHNVLNMLLAEDTSYTLASLKQAVVTEYGEDVRFYTCSQQDLTFDALLAFLLDRQKVVQDGETIAANRERMCSH